MPTSELKFTQSIRDQKAVQSAQNKRKFTQLIQDQETVQSAQNKEREFTKSIQDQKTVQLAQNKRNSLNRSEIRKLFDWPKPRDNSLVGTSRKLFENKNEFIDGNEFQPSFLGYSQSSNR